MGIVMQSYMSSTQKTENDSAKDGRYLVGSSLRDDYPFMLAINLLQTVSSPTHKSSAFHCSYWQISKTRRKLSPLTKSDMTMKTGTSAS